MVKVKGVPESHALSHEGSNAALATCTHCCAFVRPRLQQQRRHAAAGETSEATGMSHNCCAEAEAVPEEGEVRRQAAKDRRRRPKF